MDSFFLPLLCLEQEKTGSVMLFFLLRLVFLGPAPVFSLAVITMNIVTVLSAEILLTDAPAYNTKSFISGLLLSSE